MKRKKISVFKRETHDGQSGWTGTNMFIRDSEGFLNDDGKYHDEPVWGTIDLSGNGYCFNEENVDKAVKKIESFYKLNSMNSFSDLKEYFAR